MNLIRRKKLQTALVIAVNIIFIVGLIFVFFMYDADYKKKLYDQNVDDITNINQSSANVSSSFFSSRETKLRDLALYINKNNLTLSQSMDYIFESSSDQNMAFEFLGTDHSGYRVKKDENGSYCPVSYSYSYAALIKAMDKSFSAERDQEVYFMSEFTDNYTAVKSFALYIILDLADSSGQIKPYALMCVADSADFISKLNLNSGYEELSTVIVNARGDYIIGNNSFKSDNFYQYLYVFNGLTLDQKNGIESQVSANGKGLLEYKDSGGKSCVFVYTQVRDTEWDCISCVPIDKFHNRSFDITFTMIVIAILLFMLVIDFLYLSALNRSLKISVRNEREASAAKTDFLSRMSHDIRTPLNVIIGMSLLAQNENNPAETVDCLKNIDESGKFLLGLVNDILDLNKVESGKMELHPEPYCYSEFCGHINAVVVPLCQSKSIQFEFSGNMQDRYVMLDRLRVNQIFFNLLSNAVKFTPSGGKIQLICHGKLTPDNKIAFDFEVKDSGIGMSKEFQEHMFEAFSQEHRKETAAIQGTGLGLAIVANLVKLMDGELRVESEIGKGTTFFVHIEAPFADYHDDKKQEEISDSILSGRRVLLCEDHPLNAKIAIKLLEKKNITVEHASDGGIGLSMFTAAPQNYFDAVLMDIRMPVMDGLETTRKIRALEREDAKTVPIIAMTANAYDIDKQNSFDAGMNAHIAKPIDPDLLFKTLEQKISENRK